MEEQRDTTVPTKLGSRSSSHQHMKNNDGRGAKASKQCTINNINIFVANIFFLNIARTALRAYIAGSIRTLERRFGLSSTATGVILGLTDMMHVVLVLFLGYFGRTSHKPRLIGVTSIFSALTGLLMASPYLIVPTNESPSLGVHTMFNNTGVSPDLFAKMMGQQSGFDPSQIAKMMGQQPGVDPAQTATLPK